MTNPGRHARSMVLDAPNTPVFADGALSPRAARRGSGLPGEAGAVARAVRSLAGLFVVAWAFLLDGYLTFTPWLAIAVTALGLTGLLIIIAAWLPESVLSDRRQHQIGWIAIAAVVVALGLWSYFQVFTAPNYGTDELAFDQYAAQLALHGINPYLQSMAPAFPLFHVSPNGYTFQLNGQPVTALSYPALSFEAYLPLIAVGVSTQAAVWVDVAAWAVGAVLLYLVLPRRLASLAVVVASASIYIGYSVGGVTDTLFVPLLIGAAAGWDRFARVRGPSAWRGPVCLGLAMAVKQTPWLVFPFVVAGIVLEARRDADLVGSPSAGRAGVRAGLRYTAIAAAAFALPNLPYLIADPGAWLGGIMTPFTAHSVPSGQGLVSVSLYLMVGGGSLLAYNIAAIVVFVALFVCYLATYPALKPAAFLLPSVALFFAGRSFGSYLVMLIPATLAAAATTARRGGQEPWRRWRWAAAIGTLVTATVITVAVTTPSPLAMSIQSVRTTGQLATVQQVTVAVANNTDASVTPSFTVQDGTSLTEFWQREKGPAVLGPHQLASYTLAAPSYFAMPSIQDSFQVLAFLGSPASVSRTAPYLPTTWRVVLDPETIGHPVAVGQQITVRAEIVNRINQPVQVAGVPVYLGQVIYDQQGLEYSQAVINNAMPGQTPVQALTDGSGVATFTIQSPVSNSDPVYFEANLVNQTSFYPYGYSPILAVRFGS